MIPPFPRNGKGWGTHIIPLFLPAAFTHASTSSACPAGVTGENTCTILPSGPMRNVLRTIPITFLPYMFFSLRTSNFLATSFLSSASRVNGRFSFSLNFNLGLGCVGRDAENHQPGLLEFLVCVAKLARLNDSTRGIGFRIEEEHHGLSPELFEGSRVSVFVGEGKLGSFVVGFHIALSIPQNCPAALSLSLLAVFLLVTLVARRKAPAAAHREKDQARTAGHRRDRVPARRQDAAGAHRAVDGRQILRRQPVRREPGSDGG